MEVVWDNVTMVTAVGRVDGLGVVSHKVDRDSVDVR